MQTRPLAPAPLQLTADPLDGACLVSADYPYPLTAETDYHTFMLGPEEGDRLDASIATRYPDWKNRKARLGMQFNIALTDFTPETGGT